MSGNIDNDGLGKLSESELNERRLVSYNQLILMASVRILHASDLHIAEQENITSPADHFTPGTIKDAVINRMLASSYNTSILRSFAEFAYYEAQKGTLDAILLTGDIATTGLPKDLTRAFEVIHAPADPGHGAATEDGKTRLSGVGLPILLLPGNHDRYETTGYGYVPGGVEFDTVFWNYWQGPVKQYKPIRKSGLKVTVIAVDFNLKRSRESDRVLGWLAQGRVYGEILDQLEDTTEQLPAADRQCVIWAMHFPPAYPRVSPYLQLLDSDLLVLRANKCGIKAVVAGHTHDAVKYRRPDMKFDVFCAGTVSQAFAPEGNHFRIIEIRSDESTNITINSEEYCLRGFGNEFSINRPGFRKV